MSYSIPYHIQTGKEQRGAVSVFQALTMKAGAHESRLHKHTSLLQRHPHRSPASTNLALRINWKQKHSPPTHFPKTSLQLHQTLGWGYKWATQQTKYYITIWNVNYSCALERANQDLLTVEKESLRISASTAITLTIVWKLFFLILILLSWTHWWHAS